MAGIPGDFGGEETKSGAALRIKAERPTELTYRQRHPIFTSFRKLNLRANRQIFCGERPRCRSVFVLVSYSTMDPNFELLRQRFPLATTQIAIADWRFELYRPSNPDDLISDFEFDRDGRLPYWAELWPSATAMARQIAAEQGACERMGTGSDQFAGGPATQTDREVPVPILSHPRRAGRRLLELGCGLGLVSLAAIRAGFDVIATDYYEEALAFTELNARHNELPPPATRLVDWRRFPEDLGRFDLVVASDVLFEKPNIPLIAAAFSRTLAPGGRGLLTDPGRPPAAAFPAECERHGLQIIEHPPIPVSKPDKPDAPQMIRFFEIRLA
jgi:ETFB lysine methyltransferase